MDIIYSFWKGGHNLEPSCDVRTLPISSDVSTEDTSEIIDHIPEENRSSVQCLLENESKINEISETTVTDEVSYVSNNPWITQTAVKSAKSFGSFLYSMANKAGHHVSETAKQVKHTIEENSILSDFNKEQEMFVRSKSSNKESRSAPWVGCVDEASVKQQILSLSCDKRNFVRNPPAAAQFEFNFEEMHLVAEAALAEDKNLQGMRFNLVPKLVNEATFWRNYFYRVSLIKQSAPLASSGNEKGSSNAVSETTYSHSLKDNTSEDGIKGEEDWEQELQKELQEYEVVADTTEAHTDWEKEIAEMLDTEESKPLST